VLIHVNLGSNIEPRRSCLRSALVLIGETPGLTVAGTSRLYETDAIEMSENAAGPFFNVCAALRTSLSPEKILQRTQDIECRLGRPQSRTRGHTSRVIDIDLVLAEERVLSRPDLCIPHPALVTRSFFLWPLVEICPNAVWPATGLLLRRYLSRRVTPPIRRTLFL
jgi:2-amino-4-hydroxy-6-hydroxymethyldihydropteridine diphosphokinase